MPAPQLHLTFGELLGRERGLADELLVACANEPVYTRLGSIFHDLPYYGNMPLMAIRYGLKRPAEESYWGYKLHYDEPDRFLACYIEAAREVEGLSEQERLALIAGLCSHVALDLSMHPLVNYIARRDAAALGGAESHHHRLAEKYHSMFFHLDTFGRDCIGSSEMYARTRVTKHTSVVRRCVEPAIVNFTNLAYDKMWKDGPGSALFQSWVRSFAHFGIMVGGRMALRNSLRLRTLENRKHYFKSSEFDFYDFWQAGRKRGVLIANLAFEYFGRADFSAEARAKFIADVAFDGNLAEPEGRYGPQLPATAATYPASQAA